MANIYNMCYDEADKDTVFQMLAEALDHAFKSNNEEVITRIAFNISILQLRDIAKLPWKS